MTEGKNGLLLERGGASEEFELLKSDNNYLFKRTMFSVADDGAQERDAQTEQDNASLQSSCMRRVAQHHGCT
jgi:hypothetical protein